MNKNTVWACIVAAFFFLTIASFSRAQYWKNTSNSWATVAGETFGTAEHCVSTLNKCMDLLDVCEDLRVNKYEL